MPLASLGLVSVTKSLSECLSVTLFSCLSSSVTHGQTDSHTLNNLCAILSGTIRTGQDWSGVIRTGQNRSRPVKTGQDWSGMIRTGQYWSGLVKIVWDRSDMSG